MIRVDSATVVSDQSGVAEARRAAVLCAENLRLGEVAVGKAALVATELASNQLKHGGSGSILFGARGGDKPGLAIIAIDRGKGISNLEMALADGYSTAGSPGTGLGAIHRASSFVDLYSAPGKGTVLLAQIAPENGRAPATEFVPRLVTVGGVCIAKRGEEESGDSWHAANDGDTTTVMVVDGLGHGPSAASASSAAIGVFSERHHRPLEELLQDLHGALRPTRGAAVGVGRIQPLQRRCDFAGVGNISGTVVSDHATRKTVSHGGIVGHQMRKVQSFSYPWMAESVLLLHSDGLSTSWNLADYPGLLNHDPALVAAVLYRDHCRGTDDVTVVVAKAN